MFRSQFNPLRAARHPSILIIASLILSFSVASGALAATFIPLSATPAGEYDGTEYVAHFGFFAGTTAKGDFVMPYQIISPANPGDGNGAVLIEPPHAAFGPIGLGVFLGDDLIFSRGFSHATVGFSELLLNILAPIPGLEIAGEPANLCDPGTDPICKATRDVEIIQQFSEALKNDPWAVSVLAPVTKLYAFGVSQTAEVLNEMTYSLNTEGLFDFTLLMLNVWQIEVPTWGTGIPDPGAIPDDFVPLDGIGKVIIVNAEGDQFFSEAEELRDAINHPHYRLYEVAGAPHFPSIYLPPSFPGLEILNPLSVAPVGRAALIAGHHWATDGTNPPDNALLVGTESGIARDGDGNALGGVQLPDIAVGRGKYIAWTDFPPLPLPGGAFVPLLGLFDDLTCEPPAGSDSGLARFRNHGSFVSAYAGQAIELVRQGYLLPEDAESMIGAAGDSDVGEPKSCD